MTAGLAAAAMVARDGRYAVTVLLSHARRQIGEATEAADAAGVDMVVRRAGEGTAVHFIARHQDRRVLPGALHRHALRPLVRPVSLDQPGSAPPGTAAVDLIAFRQASEALALGERHDPEAELIRRHLLGAAVGAHACGGMPTLMVNDVGGLVGLLRRRARTRGAALRINPDACACR